MCSLNHDSAKEKMNWKVHIANSCIDHHNKFIKGNLLQLGHVKFIKFACTPLQVHCQLPSNYYI